MLWLFIVALVWLRQPGTRATSRYMPPCSLNALGQMRPPTPTHVQFQDHKLVFRRYAHLYFIMCLDVGDNELAALEAIHLFVEILDHFFTSVTELDIVLNFHKV